MLHKYSERGDEGLLPAVEELVQHDHLLEHLRGLTREHHLAPNEWPIGHRHPNGFVKIRLVSLADIGWTLRLHVWNTHSSDRDIHNHRWCFASYVLRGSLIERCYECTLGPGPLTMYDCSPSEAGQYTLNNPCTCDVNLLAENTYQSGSSYERRTGTLHLATTKESLRPVVTLFVQGSEKEKSTTVIRSKRAASGLSNFAPLCGRQELMDTLRMVLDVIPNE